MEGGDIAGNGAANGAATAPRVLGEFTTIAELQSLLRARAEQLQISREQLDDLAGLAKGYASKLLAPSPVKKIGLVTMPALLGALGLKLVLVDDPEQRARIAERFTPRNPAYAAHAGTVTVIFSRRHMRQIQKRGGRNSRKYMTREEASWLASKAGKNSRKNVSSKRARELAQAAGRLGAAARWGEIKRAVRDPRSDGNGRGPSRPPKGNGAA
jgi:hypothetical protein